jgi:hypothetical protein
MLTTPEAPSFPPELRRAWGAEGEEEYRQLLRVTKAARGSFFLFLIESDYSPAVRDTMLDCLRDDLSAGGGAFAARDADRRLYGFISPAGIRNARRL